MSASRIEQLRQFLVLQPDDDFLIYAMALEFVSLGEVKNAFETFEKLKLKNPDYSATYYQLGKLYEASGNNNKAIEIFREGIEICTRLKEHKNTGELRSALDELTDEYD